MNISGGRGRPFVNIVVFGLLCAEIGEKII